MNKRKNLLIINIKSLIQVSENPHLKRGEELANIESIDNAYLYAENGIISNYGKMQELPSNYATIINAKCNKDPHSFEEIEIIDAKGKYVLPTFCDSHTHIVYAGSREQEFVDKINGLTYQEIAARGGGILNSAKLLHNSSEEELYNSAMKRVQEVVATGTGAIEIKSGYGLNHNDELKILKVIQKIKQNTPICVKSTYLGAHAYPEKYRNNHNGYIEEIINETIPAIGKEKLADFIDVFCEEGFFTVNDTERIFEAGIKYGLRPKVHANQMSFSGGVQTGVKYNAISVDHLESIAENEFKALINSNTIATMLPGATFFLNMNYAPARKIIDYGIPVALASNYNPGSCPSGNIQFAMTLACIKMKMSPIEALNACTINGAYAMGIENEYGSITNGKKASLIITKEIPSMDFIPYSFTTPFIDKIVL